MDTFKEILATEMKSKFCLVNLTPLVTSSVKIIFAGFQTKRVDVDQDLALKTQLL